MANSMKKHRAMVTFLIHLFLILFSIVMIAPFVWMTLTAFKSISEATALATMQGQYTTKYPELMAASLIACVPMIVLYLLFQRQFIEGIATSGGKL